LLFSERRRLKTVLSVIVIPERPANTMQTALPEPKQRPSAGRRRSFPASLVAALTIIMMFCLLCPATQVHAAKERDLPSPGFVTEFSATLDDVLQALQDVLQDQIIHGTYMFEKEKTLTGATAVESTPLFEPWREGGKVFYKIRNDVIAPRHFRDSADRGTIAVRYIVTSVSPERTRLRIDAIFVEDARHGAHPSDGTVESSESKIIQEHVQAIQDARQEAAENQRRLESIDLAKQSIIRQREDETARLAAAESSVRDLEQRVDALRHQIEMRIKAPGASLKSAPFRSASDEAGLAAYTDVLIVIVTPRWYGVETPDGQRGWVPQGQLEPLP
jgi:peptidoglycan hydrolase CwlO-like protein